MAEITRYLKHRRDTAANWTANNPTLLAGQLGIETDGLTTTPKFKIGDGVTAWNTLPYAGGGSLSTVLAVGNTTSGQDIVLTDDDKLQIGSTAGRYIGYDTNLIQIGLGIINTNSNDHIVLQDGGGIHVDTTFVELPHLTASRVIATDANNRLSALTGTGLLKLTSGAISYDTNTYLTTSAAALAYQPLDADLTSWASVTRATGFDTFVATPSSANLSSLLTDKTGTGVNVFGTSPTFTTDITTPIVYGSSSASGTLTIDSTSNATKGAIIFGTASSGNVYNFNVGSSSALVRISGRVGATNQAAIYFNQSSPAVGNAALYGLNTTTILNCTGGGTVNIANGGTTLAAYTNTSITWTPPAVSSGATTSIVFTLPSNTGQTATEIPNFKVTGSSKTFANGGGAATIATQRWNYFTANTAATSGGGSLTITNSYGLYVEAATAGTNATITNNWALGTNGNIWIDSSSASIYLGNITPSSSNYALSYTAANELSVNAISTMRLRVGGTIYGTLTATSLSLGNYLTLGNVGSDIKLYMQRTGGKNTRLETTTASTRLYNESDTLMMWTAYNNGSFAPGLTSALATNATDGFLYVPSCAGIPTGVPTAITGKIPIVADSTNNKLYIYSGGAWVALN